MIPRSRISVATLAVASALTLALTGCSGAASSGEATAADSAGGYAVDSNTLVFGVVPDSVDTETNYQPLMDYIAQETGKTVEYHPCSVKSFLRVKPSKKNSKSFPVSQIQADGLRVRLLGG